MPGSAATSVQNKDIPVISAEIERCLKASGIGPNNNTVIDFVFGQIHKSPLIFLSSILIVSSIPLGVFLPFLIFS
jgi:hypothetical protein